MILTVPLKSSTVISMPNITEEELAEKTSSIAMVVAFFIASYMGYQLIGPALNTLFTSTQSVAFASSQR